MSPFIVVLSGLGDDGAPPDAPAPLPAAKSSSALWAVALAGLLVAVVLVARSTRYFVKTKNGYRDFGTIEDAREYRRRFGGRIYLKRGEHYEDAVLVS